MRFEMMTFFFPAVTELGCKTPTYSRFHVCGYRHFLDMRDDSGRPDMVWIHEEKGNLVEFSDQKLPGQKASSPGREPDSRELLCNVLLRISRVWWGSNRWRPPVHELSALIPSAKILLLPLPPPPPSFLSFSPLRCVFAKLISLCLPLLLFESRPLVLSLPLPAGLHCLLRWFRTWTFIFCPHLSSVSAFQWYLKQLEGGRDWVWVLSGEAAGFPETAGIKQEIEEAFQNKAATFFIFFFRLAVVSK